MADKPSDDDSERGEQAERPDAAGVGDTGEPERADAARLDELEGAAQGEASEAGPDADVERTAEPAAEAISSDEASDEVSDEISDEVSDAAPDEVSGEASVEASTAEADAESTETDAPAEAREAAPEAAPPKPKGRLLAALALLLALAGVGGVGYLYYLLVYLDPLRTLQEENASARADSGALRDELSAQIAEVQRQAQALAAETESSVASLLDENEAAVVKSLNEAINQAPPSERVWKLAEAEYLMRIANHRVLMENDSAGALRLLEAADAIIAELDDFAFHQVRARLADEILALRQVRRDDLQGVYLRLEAVKTQLGDLPITTPEYLERTDSGTEEETVLQVLANELKQLVRVRTVAADESLKPLLAPEEERYLELNLRLSIEQAQLAVLKRHQGVFEHSLSRAREWLAAYLDQDDERTQAVQEMIDELLTIKLDRDLPDISGSLSELVALRRTAE